MKQTLQFILLISSVEWAMGAEQPAANPATAAAQKELPAAASPEDQKKSVAAYTEALEIEKKKDLPGAIAKWEEALKLDPRNTACLNHYAWFLGVSAPAEHRNLAKGLELSQLADRIAESKNHDILDTVAEIHFQRGDFEKAIEAQKKALQPGLTGNCDRNYLEKQLKKFEKAQEEARKKSP